MTTIYELLNEQLPNIKTIMTGKRTGMTSYIDYIKQDEMIENVMKGRDNFGREFIVVKAHASNNKKNNDPTIILFQTFFKRYAGLGNLWMGCGHDGNHIIETTGGMTDSQHKFLYDLITNGIYVFSYNEINELRLSNQDIKSISIQTITY